ncbi:hypothetical protein EST38_g2682 [Candolleomyces aberdarensis]|uniref:Uncharacterized protein n=1 Tax=Candolleomyces aberdarensis TaxID=2316362 RepID=A0A4Q2DSE1_9AGAR|nr:hypothetical protein EST38_g2682 [Candolleomyces aberdarensis]
MGDFSSTLGALLVAVFINTYLYGVVSFQYASYYNSNFRDPRWVTLTIGALFVIDTFHSISIIYMAWVYAVDNFSNPNGLIREFASLILSVVHTIGLSSPMLRVWWIISVTLKPHSVLILTKQYIIYVPLIAIAVSSFAGGMTVGIKVWLADTMMGLSSVNNVLTFWLTAEAAIDVLIAVILSYTLNGSRTGMRKSDKVLNRLMKAI